jgi:hypothetical protein
MPLMQAAGCRHLHLHLHLMSYLIVLGLCWVCVFSLPRQVPLIDVCLQAAG